MGWIAPNSESAEVLSKALENKTVLSGSISRGKNDPSQSLQMIQRPLMTPDELKSLPKGHFIPTMAKELGMSRSTIKRGLEDLVSAGYMKKGVRYRENGSYTSNLYTLL